MKKAIVLVFWSLSLSVIAQQANLIAHYPLTSTAIDTTGHLGPMTLTHAPFLGSGIYCNGFYIGAWPQSGCHVETPDLPASIFKSFSVSAEFKVDSAGPMPVLTGGMSYRWIGCQLRSDSTLELKYNNIFIQHSAAYHLTMKTWHELTLTYDSLSATAKMYIDGNLIISANYTIIHGTGGDRNFSTTNPGTGKAFKGFLRNLKIYTGVIIPNVGVEDLAGSSPVRFYPNPNNGSFKIDLLNAAHNPICIEIYNPTGSRILNLTCSNQNIPEEINLSGFSKGIYLAKISDGIKIYAEKIVIH